MSGRDEEQLQRAFPQYLENAQEKQFLGLLAKIDHAISQKVVDILKKVGIIFHSICNNYAGLFLFDKLKESGELDDVRFTIEGIRCRKKK